MTLEYDREREEADARRRAMVREDPHPRGAALFAAVLADPEKYRPARRINWCSRCSSRAIVLDRTRRKVDATPSEAQPGGSLCSACASLEFKALVALKIGAANARGDSDGAAAWLELQRTEEKRVATGGKGRAEYPFLPEEKLEAMPAFGDEVEIPEDVPADQASFWAQFTEGDGKP